MDPTAVAKQFTDYYYSTFDSDRRQLGPLYRQESMLTYEGVPIMGAGNIIDKLASLPFQKVMHRVVTLDVQPSSKVEAAIIVSVTGQLVVDDGSIPLSFSQVFQLVPDAGSYFVYNDIFRLNYG